jgi:hypothetical protein
VEDWFEATSGDETPAGVAHVPPEDARLKDMPEEEAEAQTNGPEPG